MADALRRSGREVEILPWGRALEDESRPAKLLSRSRDLLRARRAVRRGGFPIVIVNTAHTWSSLARDIALTRVLQGQMRSVVLQIHGSQSQRLIAPGSRMFKRATELLLRSTDALLVVSRQEQSEWRAFSPQAHVEVVRYPKPTMPAVEGDGRAELPTILFVGRLLAEKGLLDLISAMPAVTRQTNCRLLVAGHGPAADPARALAVDLGVGHSVQFAGHLDDEGLARLYSSAAVFALPTYWDEGFPTVILEAMAAGLPIVTTRWRGPADHLVEGRNALFVPPRDSDAVATALTRLLDDPDLRRRMSQANLEKVREFEPDAAAEEYLAALERIVTMATCRTTPKELAPACEVHRGVGELRERCPFEKRKKSPASRVERRVVRSGLVLDRVEDPAQEIVELAACESGVCAELVPEPPFHARTPIGHVPSQLLPFRGGADDVAHEAASIGSADPDASAWA